jgi:glycosyltransferase involved in cell wall biosynthesis
MRVLYLCPEYPPAPCGGIGHFYAALARGAARCGVETTVIAIDPGAELATRTTEDGVDVLRLPGAALSGPRLRLGRRRWDCSAVRARIALWRAASTETRRRRAHVVETYDWSGPAPWKPSAPFVVRMHGASAVRRGYLGQRASRLLTRCERRTLAASDALAAVSGFIGRRTLETFALRREFQIVPNGVDARLFSPGLRPPPSDEILYVGSIRDDKGVGLLLDAFALLGGRQPGLRLRLAGALPIEGRDAPFLERRLHAMEPRLRSRIHFEGRLPQLRLPEFYRKASVCVFPSAAEAHPLACLEAMSCGAAVIANAEGGMAETVEDGLSGMLVLSSRPAAWAAAMEALLSSSERRAEFGRQARLRVERRFALDSVIAQNLALYAQAAAQGRAQ